MHAFLEMIQRILLRVVGWGSPVTTVLRYLFPILAIAILVRCAISLLGFRKDAAPLLTELKTRSRIPILSKTADAPALLGTGTPAAKMLASEAYASALWDSVYFERTGIRLPEFPQKQVVIV